MRAARPAVGSAAGPVVGAASPGSGASGPSISEHVPNPTFAGDGSPWDAGGSAIDTAGKAQWFEDGNIVSPLDDDVPNATDFTLTVDLTNGAGVNVIVRLYNIGANTNQVAYTGAGTNQIVVNGTTTAIRDRIRVEGMDAGLGALVVTRVSLTTSS